RRPKGSSSGNQNVDPPAGHPPPFDKGNPRSEPPGWVRWWVGLTDDAIDKVDESIKSRRTNSTSPLPAKHWLQQNTMPKYGYRNYLVVSPSLRILVPIHATGMYSYQHGRNDPQTPHQRPSFLITYRFTSHGDTCTSVVIH
ncbi:hypothetical protein CABS01_03041, partial [Colletotrichum abscissum]|uniref:uncharacterized protein n=1 Tax=Colletotrichum abscissum TaxID=1671311 RepID=UPI0027D495F4